MILYDEITFVRDILSAHLSSNLKLFSSDSGVPLSMPTIYRGQYAIQPTFAGVMMTVNNNGPTIPDKPYLQSAVQAGDTIAVQVYVAEQVSVTNSVSFHTAQQRIHDKICLYEDAIYQTLVERLIGHLSDSDAHPLPDGTTAVGVGNKSPSPMVANQGNQFYQTAQCTVIFDRINY